MDFAFLFMMVRRNGDWFAFFGHEGDSGSEQESDEIGNALNHFRCGIKVLLEFFCGVICFGGNVLHGDLQMPCPWGFPPSIVGINKPHP